MRFASGSGARGPLCLKVLDVPNAHDQPLWIHSVGILRPDFALPETAFHLERFRGFADISADGGYDRSRGMRSGDRGWTFEARKP
jgi:hypothetical protein